MLRSLRLAPKYIQLVKLSLKQKGFQSQQALAEAVALSRPTISSFLNGRPIDYPNFVEICRQLGLDWQEVADSTSLQAGNIEASSHTAKTRRDWGEAPNIAEFYGRKEELDKLENWIIDDSCRLVAILGMGGMGKTALSVRLGQIIQDKFEYTIWLSLREAPLVENILGYLIKFLSNQREVALPDTVEKRISRLIDYLGSSRCLVILDNFEAVLQSGSTQVGKYIHGYEKYGVFLHQVGESRHQSCLLLTSRDKPEEIRLQENKNPSVRSFLLTGLQNEAIEIFSSMGLNGAEEDKIKIIQIAQAYSGNPLLLKIVSASIKLLFGGNISEFISQKVTVFSGVSDLLNEQFNQLSELEKIVMYWLAINREAVGVRELLDDITPQPILSKLVESLESLKWRSLVETVVGGLFTLQNVIMEYVTERLIKEISEEILQKKFKLLASHALVKATAKEHIIETQIRLIVKPIINSIIDIDKHLINALEILKPSQTQTSPEYAVGNMINFLCQLNIDLRNYDFSHKKVKQAYLQGVVLPGVNFAYSDLSKSRFTDALSSVLSVAISPDKSILVTGDANDEIRVWRVADGQQILTCKGHTDWIWSIAFSPNGKTIASGSDDATVRIWDVATGECLKILTGHGAWVRSVSFNPNNNGKTLASGNDNGELRIWDVDSGECITTFQARHAGRIWSVSFSPDGKTLASGSEDKTIKLWDVCTEQDPLKHLKYTLAEHTGRVQSVSFSSDSKTLASGSEDKTIKLWNVCTGECTKTLQNYESRVWSIAFSPERDSKTLVSGSDDKLLRMWNATSGECIRVLDGHHGRVWSVAFGTINPKNSRGSTIVSGSDDHTAKIWDASTGQCLKTLQGYANGILSIAFSPNGETLASGSENQTVTIWDVATGQCRKTWQEHTNWLWSIAFSPDGKTLACGSDDKVVKVWDVSTGVLLKKLEGHTNWVLSVAFSYDGETLASGSEDKTVRIWDVRTNKSRRDWQSHTDRVRSVAFSPDGKTLVSGSDDKSVRLWTVETGEDLELGENIDQRHFGRVRSVAFEPNEGKTLASGSDDATVKIWKVATGECVKTLKGHADKVVSVAFSPNGEIIASGSDDTTVKIWDVATGKCLRTLKGHSNWVRSVAFSSNGEAIASCSEDETIKVWDLQTGDCRDTLRAEKPYNNMNIKGVKGLTEAQKSTLKALGAVEQDE